MYILKSEHKKEVNGAEYTGTALSYSPYSLKSEHKKEVYGAEYTGTALSYSIWKRKLMVEKTLVHQWYLYYKPSIF